MNDGEPINMGCVAISYANGENLNTNVHDNTVVSID